MGWQSKHCTSCFVVGVSFNKSRTPSAPENGLPFQVIADEGR